MKSLIVLWRNILEELGDRCCTSTSHDLKTVMARSEHEGLSFLTITLPAFGKDFERSLDQGMVTHDLFEGFSFAGGLPRFLGGFLELVFDRTSGSLVEAPSIEAIYAVRQLTLMFGKINLPCSDARIANAIQAYLDCESDVHETDNRLYSGNRDDSFEDSSQIYFQRKLEVARFSRVAALLWSEVFSAVDRDVYNGNILPKHGPGATADKLRGNSKFSQSSWTRRLESVFPCSDFLIPNARFYSDLDRVDIIEPGAEIPVKVITVPKTLKTPRIIAIEPTCMQYVQQGIMEKFVEYLEAPHRIFSGIVGFSDQAPNWKLAKKGSLQGNLATLDLSEASDRVSNQLVLNLFKSYPDLSDAVQACRSTRADVPGKGIYTLAKFASMGSALTFPVEAMVFATLIFCGIERELNRPLTPKDIYILRGKVRVYGDDIIVPVHYVRSVVETLEFFGFKVNSSKSFWKGLFRESCGKEYYHGSDVSIVRVREMFPSQLTDASGVVSTVSLRNQLYFAGLWKTCAWMDKELSSLLRGVFPTVHTTSPVLGRHSLLGFETQKLDRHLHSPLVKGYVLSSRPPKDLLDGYAALLKVFLKRGDKPFADVRHLERQGRPHSVDIKMRWAPSC